MSDEKIIIKRLEPANLDQVNQFRMSHSDDKPLQNFIRRKARKSASANLTQTYVAKVENTLPIIGYISVMCAEIKLDNAYEIGDKPDADIYEYQPAVRISRLAVEDSYRGKNVGRELVEMAIGITIYAIVPNAGCRFLILDAKPKSILFYEKLGFRLLDTDENRSKATPLMFMDLRPC
ncbi:MAG: GNAT family N-acetyltransferase [Sphingomonadaceae bacterium]|nr:GNAT family N-acetyltransferase [Sphingomonadaceae bacterium]